MNQPLSLSRKMVRAARAFGAGEAAAEVAAKVKIALLDMLSCVFESQDLPWSRQAIDVVRRTPGGAATLIGTPLCASPSDAAFVNAILAHGLVREDMHTGSVSHLGVVIFPVLLALAQRKKVAGRDFIAAAVCGYEIGAAVGKALMDQETVRIFRPTGITGPLGAAIAGSLLLGLTEDAAVSALGLAANSAAGLNEWPHSGADDMFFHAGFAARNAVTAVELAELGAYASESALDGRAGLFAALRRAEKIADAAPFSGNTLEIMSVYHKPAPACNYAQTACQAALALAVEDRVDSTDVAAIQAKVTAAALNYPGCNAPGPFERILPAKMSIQYCVAATLARGCVEEGNYRLLDDPEIRRLASIVTLEEDPEFTGAYPQQQGAAVAVTLRSGRTVQRRLDDLIPATAAQIRARFRSACAKVLGAPTADEIESMADQLEALDDAGALGSRLALTRERVAV